MLEEFHGGFEVDTDEEIVSPASFVAHRRRVTVPMLRFGQLARRGQYVTACGLWIMHVES